MLDSLDVHQQKSNGTAVVAKVGVSGNYTKNLNFGADLRLTSYGSGKEHKVSANVAPEQTAFTVGHYGVGNSIFGLGLSAEYKINKDSSLGFGLRFEGDDSMSDGFRGDINYRRRF